MSCVLPQERAVLRVHHEHLEPALHQHQESHLVAVLRQGHQLHQLPHPQHGEMARLTSMTFFLFVVLSGSASVILTWSSPLLCCSCPRCAPRSTAAWSRDWRLTTKSSCRRAKVRRCLGRTRSKQSRDTLRRLRITMKPWSSSCLHSVSSKLLQLILILSKQCNFFLLDF